MKQSQIENVGKIFVVVGGMRRSLICDGVFTPHKLPIMRDHVFSDQHGSEQDEGTLDPCSPFLSPIDSSSSQARA